MDEEQGTREREEAMATAADVKRGKVFASYLVRVTLREPDVTRTDYESFAPTNGDVVAIVERALAEALDGVPSVTSERLDV